MANEASFLETTVKISDRLVYDFSQQWIRFKQEAQVSGVCWFGKELLERKEVFHYDESLDDVSRQAAVIWHFQHIDPILENVKEKLEYIDGYPAQLYGELMVIEVDYTLTYNCANLVHHRMVTILKEKPDRIELATICQGKFEGTSLAGHEFIPYKSRLDTLIAGFRFHKAKSSWMLM